MAMIDAILRDWWGYTSFRPGQREIIESAMSGKDTLALLPTGGGKSLCFQLPALAKEGICIVVSPLIALIKDQVGNLNKRGIPALAVHSGMSYQKIDITLDNAIYGDYKFLYVSPERLKSQLFMARVAKMAVNFLVVDEAHCISQWGYDFRPAYLDIKEIKRVIGEKVPIIALTATATKEVVADIVEKLDFGEHKIISSGFERPNLSYVVRETEDKFGNLLRVCKGVPGTGIVYVRERKKCEELAAFLIANGFSADYYHAGLSKELRSLKQEQWKRDKTRIIVATNAFGMGIDKPDVRFVLHFDLPESLEAYFQEAGRAGRDGLRSYTTLLWNSSDIKRLRALHNISYPSVEYIKEIYQKVFIYLQIPFEWGKDSVNKFNLQEFARQFKLNAVSAYYAIKLIEQEGYWQLTDELDNPSRMMFTVNRDELYRVQLNNKIHDSFIKSLLRLYTALFSKLVQIDEAYIAKATSDSVAGVKEKLIQLSKMRIIKYIPKLRTPLIIMNNERLYENNFYISEKRYNERKEMFVKRIESVIGFVECDDTCRSRHLIGYFGQESDSDCGICDICLSKRGRSGGKREREVVASRIIAFLREKNAIGLNWVTLAEISALAGDEYQLYIDVLRELVDYGKIKIAAERVSTAISD